MKSLVAVLALGLPAVAAAQENSYLEIPVTGRIGVQVTPAGIENCLKLAEERGIKHVVFAVDSLGGDQLAARDIFNLIGKHDKKFSYHAIVRDAVGVAVGFLVFSDSIFVRPGAGIGGVHLVVDEAKMGLETSIVLSHIALNAGDRARQHGHSAELIRAMVDPAEKVMAWRDAQGKIQFGRSVPADVPASSILLKHEGGTVLTLKGRQAISLGFARAFDGGADGLGAALKLPGWKAGADAQAVVERAAKETEAKAASAQTDRQRFLIEQNTKRREAAKAGIERFLNLANEWNPKLGTYSTYKETGIFWNDYHHGDGYDTGRMTQEARRKWRDRTDVTIEALARAKKGVLEMKQLDKDARGLGLEPSYPEGKLDEIRADLDLKIAMLTRERDKRYVDDRKPN